MSVNMKLINSPDFKRAVVKEFHTNTPIAEISEKLGTLPVNVSTVFKQVFSKKAVKERKSRVYAASKIGDKNPSYGRTGEDAFHYKGERVADGNGYYMVPKPEWYTGRKGSKYIFEHSMVMCEALGLTEIPKGWVVHHVDGDRANNDLNNLALLTASAHQRLHALERATAIPRGSRGSLPRSAEVPSLN